MWSMSPRFGTGWIHWQHFHIKRGRQMTSRKSHTLSLLQGVIVSKPSKSVSFFFGKALGLLIGCLCFLFGTFCYFVWNLGFFKLALFVILMSQDPRHAPAFGGASFKQDSSTFWWNLSERCLSYGEGLRIWYRAMSIRLSRLAGGGSKCNNGCSSLYCIKPSARNKFFLNPKDFKLSIILMFKFGANQSTNYRWSRYATLKGVATFLDDDRKEVLLEVAEYLEENYTQYSRGIFYLRQLAGQYALQRTKPPRLDFLLANHAARQRGAVVLQNAEVHTLHTMRVRFHRYYWISIRCEKSKSWSLHGIGVWFMRM